MKRQIFRPRKRLKTSCRWGVASNQVFHQIDAPFFWGLLGSEIDKAPVERLSFSLHRFWHAAYVFLGVLIVLVKAQQSSILFFHLLKDICLLSPVGFPAVYHYRKFSGHRPNSETTGTRCTNPWTVLQPAGFFHGWKLPHLQTTPSPRFQSFTRNLLVVFCGGFRLGAP